MQENSPRPIQTFGRRLGRKLRIQRQDKIDALLPQVQITLDDSTVPIDLRTLFITPVQHITLEIGFGAGDHLNSMIAGSASTHGFIGAEPYINGVSSFLKHLDPSDIGRVRVYSDDVRALMARLPDASLDKVVILFPDPWPKKRHTKRRLMQLEFLADVVRVLKPGGVLHFASDHADFVIWAQEQLAHTQGLTLVQKWEGGARPDEAFWPYSKYERTALVKGIAPSYFVYTLM